MKTNIFKQIQEREKLREELTSLESQLEELVCRGRREEEQVTN